eukprot:Rhum_TRINITY_DN5219_c0_g1::Rhum_TRINITY_DN5219_c0_g1_i1::g.16893::m.16893/K01279/TPP1, CLN2; tripeptidyl-peptidase I
MLSRVLCPALLAACAQAVVHETIRQPEAWANAGLATSDDLEFVFALKHSDVAKEWLRKKVAAVSNPDSKEYGRYLSLDSLTDAMAPPRRHADLVVRSLEDAGFRSVETKASRDFVFARAGRAAAEAFFGTAFCEFRSVGEPTADRIIRACELSYQLPTEVSRVVDFVGGLVHFPLSTKAAFAPSTGAGDVAVLRKSYNLDGVKPKGTNTSVAFTQFIGQRYSPADLAMFEDLYSPEQKGQKVAHKVGPTETGRGTEANLDSQYLTAMSNGVPVWAWTNQNKNPVNNQEPWATFFGNVSSAKEVPTLFSISYGEGEDTLTAAYIDRSDVELQKAAARGISLLASSGDNGSGCKLHRFVANFPASLPHMTAVGATELCGATSNAATFSSGGFANSYPRQPWQEAAVKAYLSSATLPPATYFNASGRGYPDVAACGTVLICVFDICLIPVQGTSCACPIFAGVMGLMNDARVSAGKPTLGFLAPALYKAAAADAAAFNDITGGSTTGCDGHRWSATKGWDPATGLGTPNYEKLLAQLMTY